MSLRISRILLLNGIPPNIQRSICQLAFKGMNIGTSQELHELLKKAYTGEISLYISRILLPNGIRRSIRQLAFECIRKLGQGKGCRSGSSATPANPPRSKHFKPPSAQSADLHGETEAGCTSAQPGRDQFNAAFYVLCMPCPQIIEFY
jgi:hypothetical protein